MGTKQAVQIKGVLTLEPRVKKNGDPYEMLILEGYDKKTGELVQIHEIYADTSLGSIVRFLSK